MDLVGCESEYAMPSDMPQAGPAFREARHSHMAALTLAIEAEVIPRLLLARRVEAEQQSRASAELDEIQVTHFVRLLLDRDETLAVAHLRSLLDAGIRLDTIYATLMTQAARRLGTMWDEDEINFTVVTTAVWRMQQILHTMSSVFVNTAQTPANNRRILLVPAIGDQHSFGLSMVSEYFRKAGWDVTCELVSCNDDIAALVRGSWFDVIGFSVGGEHQLAALSTTIRTTRRASRNLKLGVMVGGPVFVADPGLAVDVGADMTAADAAQATHAAEGLVTSLASNG
jgi:methanogenic corrinoid protein MtbC1